MSENEKNFIAALSFERFGRYRDWAYGNDRRALELYTLNTGMSEAFYTPLQMLEVCLRNRIHDVMKAQYDERWFVARELLQNNYQRDQVAEALHELKRRRRDSEPGRVVAELSFGFWTAMLGNPYENLWQTCLHRIASKPEGKGVTRKQFNRLLQPIRKLRNRIAHHEPIIHWDLPKHHQAILDLTGWLSPAAAAWCRRHSRFKRIYPIEGIDLAHSSNDMNRADPM